MMFLFFGDFAAPDSYDGDSWEVWSIGCALTVPTFVCSLKDGGLRDFPKSKFWWQSILMKSRLLMSRIDMSCCLPFVITG